MSTKTRAKKIRDQKTLSTTDPKLTKKGKRKERKRKLDRKAYEQKTRELHKRDVGGLLIQPIGDSDPQKANDAPDEKSNAAHLVGLDMSRSFKEAYLLPNNQKPDVVPDGKLAPRKLRYRKRLKLLTEKVLGPGNRWNQKLTDNQSAEDLLTLTALDRSKVDDRLRNIGGLEGVDDSFVDQFNKDNKLNIKNREEFVNLYRDMTIADDLVIQNASNPLVAKWDEWGKASDLINASDVAALNATLQDTVNTMNQRGEVFLNLSHGANQGNVVLHHLLNHPDIVPGVLHIEAPYSLNLHEKTATAVVGWLRFRQNGFPQDSTAAVVSEAESKGWTVVPVDATSAIDAHVNVPLLNDSGVPSADDPEVQLNRSENNPVRQNYISRNTLGSKLHHDDKGGLLAIGSAHLIKGKEGGAVQEMISDSPSFDKKTLLGGTKQWGSVQRGDLKQGTPNYAEYKPNAPKKINGTDRRKIALYAINLAKIKDNVTTLDRTQMKNLEFIEKLSSTHNLDIETAITNSLNIERKTMKKTLVDKKIRKVKELMAVVEQQRQQKRQEEYDAYMRDRQQLDED